MKTISDDRQRNTVAGSKVREDVLADIRTMKERDANCVSTCFIAVRNAAARTPGRARTVKTVHV
jgi:hypothetical protein